MAMLIIEVVVLYYYQHAPIAPPGIVLSALQEVATVIVPVL